MKSSSTKNKNRVKRPEWLKIALKTNEDFQKVDKLVSNLSLHTVCQEARCPNKIECWGQGTATFLILGDKCTRRCGFCAVTEGHPLPPDPEEPQNIAKAVEHLELDHAVITSVSRDDLPDEGSEHFARTIQTIKKQLPRCKVEVLIPDFNGEKKLLDVVLDARPNMLGHNIETVKHLYRKVRPGASYDRSLEVLEWAVKYRDATGSWMSVKSGIMVGLGETMEQVFETLEDIAATGCDILTIGQYLSPNKKSLSVQRFYTPAEFTLLKREGLRLGFRHVESGPLVRSSYHAKLQEEKLNRLNQEN